MSALVAQWIERLPPEQEVEGSNPFKGTFLLAYPLQRVGFIYAQKSKVALRAFGRLLCSRTLDPASPQPLMALFIGLSLVLDGAGHFYLNH